MITLSKTRFGKYVAMGVGRITSDPQYRTVGKNNSKVCSFMLQSDAQKTGTTKSFDSFSVNVWGDDAAYASQFEKNDEIFIVGECKKDEYWSNRNGKEEFSINAEMIIPKNVGLIALQLQMALQAMSNDSSVAMPKDASKAKDDGFIDIDSTQIPDFLQDIEPDI